MDRQFLRLSDRWALAYDRNQWIIQTCISPRRDRQGDQWRGVSFIGSNKDILWRCLEERGIDPTPEARAVIDAMPFRFLDWLAMPPARREKAPDIAILGVAAE